MNTMKHIISVILLLVAFGATAQLSFSGDYHSMGRGANNSFNIDNASLNTNPSNLGWQSKYYEHKLSINFRDYGFASYSPLLSNSVRKFFKANRYDSIPAGAARAPLTLPSELFNGDVEQGRYDTLMPRYERQDIKTALMKDNIFRSSSTLFGFTYVTPSSGTFSVQVGTEFTGRFNISDNLSDLWVFGKTASYFDTLVLADGKKLPNDSVYYENHILYDVVHAFSNDTLTLAEQLDGTQIEFIGTRNYTVGWGQEINSNINNATLFVGANLNIIEGLSYFKFDSFDDAVQIDVATSSTINDRRTNAGMGSSVSFGATMIKNDSWFMSAGVNNLGAIRWTQRKEGVSLSYDSESGEGFFKYPFGTDKFIQFDDQWDDAGVSLINDSTSAEQNVSFTRATAANASLGTKYRFNEYFSVGGDFIMPLNRKAVGSLTQYYASAAAEMSFRKFGMFSGVNNYNGQLNVPLGFSFGGPDTMIEMGFAVSDLLGYFRQASDITFSFSIGSVFRFK